MYSEKMMADLLMSCKLILLRKGENLYSKGDLSEYFYFTLRGTLSIQSRRGDPTRSIAEEQFFGFQNSPKALRSDFSVATSASV